MFVAGKDDPDVMEAFNVENVVLFLFLIAPDNQGLGWGRGAAGEAARGKQYVCEADQ